MAGPGNRSNVVLFPPFSPKVLSFLFPVFGSKTFRGEKGKQNERLSFFPCALSVRRSIDRDLSSHRVTFLKSWKENESCFLDQPDFCILMSSMQKVVVYDDAMITLKKGMLRISF